MSYPFPVGHRYLSVRPQILCFLAGYEAVCRDWGRSCSTFPQQLPEQVVGGAPFERCLDPMFCPLGHLQGLQEQDVM